MLPVFRFRLQSLFFPFRVSHDLKLPISSGKRERKSESAQQADQGSDGWTGVTLGSPGGQSGVQQGSVNILMSFLGSTRHGQQVAAPPD